jgi:hypothetical protein
MNLPCLFLLVTTSSSLPGVPPVLLGLPAPPVVLPLSLPTAIARSGVTAIPEDASSEAESPVQTMTAAEDHYIKTRLANAAPLGRCLGAWLAEKRNVMSSF